MAYKVKFIPYGSYSAVNDLTVAATEFGFPTAFVTTSNFRTGYGWLLFIGDSELDGVKLYSTVRLDSTNSPTVTSQAAVLDSAGNALTNASGDDYGIPGLITKLTSMAVASPYFIGSVVSPACGKIDGVYYLPFSAEKGKFFEFNGKKYVTAGPSGDNAHIWLIAADPTE